MLQGFTTDVLAGKRVLITGGGTGLGRGVAKFLVEHGAEVHLWGRRSSALEESAANAAAGRENVVFWQSVDVRDPEQVDAAIEKIWQEHGPLTTVLNNAAGNFIAPTESLSARAFSAVTSTVMNGTFHTTLSVGKRWIEQGLSGSILSTLATWVWTGSAFVVPSAMAKSAVHSMTMSLAVEWAKYGIRVNAVAPGPIPTDYAWDMLNPTDKSSVGATQPDQIPMKRTGKVEELAALIIFMISDLCPYMTGETVGMDGGQRLAGPNTFAGLTELTQDDWAEIRAHSTAASEAAKKQRDAGAANS